MPRITLILQEIHGSLAVLAWLEDTMERAYGVDWRSVNGGYYPRRARRDPDALIRSARAIA